MNEKTTNPESTYQIHMKGILPKSISDCIENITILSQEHGETLLIGRFPDQPALRGLLDQLWNLNFTLLSVKCVEYQIKEIENEK
jgi:hypothetical protein